MLECLFGRDPLLRIVEEDLTQQVEELLIEAGRGGNDVLDHRQRHAKVVAWDTGALT